MNGTFLWFDKLSLSQGHRMFRIEFVDLVSMFKVACFETLSKFKLNLR